MKDYPIGHRKVQANGIELHRRSDNALNIVRRGAEKEDRATNEQD